MVRALPWVAAVALVAAAALTAAASAAVTNDGRIAYVRQVTEGQTAIMTIRPDGTGERRVVGPRRHYRTPTLPRFSRDGERLAFANRAGRATLPGPLWLATVDGESVREVDTGLEWPFPAGLAWAPGGRRLVMEVARSANDRRLYVLRTDGTGRRSLGRGREPVWSPDGRWIAYVADGLYVVRPDGTGRRRLVDATAVSAPSFSPDGRRLLFTRDTASSDPVETWTVRPGGGTARKIVDRPVAAGTQLCPQQWTPDGRRLAAMRIDGTGRVFVTSAPDGSDERVEFAVPGGAADRSCDFSWQRRIR